MVIKLNIENLPKRTLETGQILVEIEENVWVDYKTLKNILTPEEVAPDGSE